MLTVDTQAPMRGRLIAAGRLVLNSWFEGDIYCSRLEIGPDGYIRGTVVAREVVTEGQIVGSVHAGTVHLLAGAFVEGDICHTALTLDRGATLSGRALRFPAIQYPIDFLNVEAIAEREWGNPKPVERTPVRRISRFPASAVPRPSLTRAGAG